MRPGVGREFLGLRFRIDRAQRAVQLTVPHERESDVGPDRDLLPDWGVDVGGDVGGFRGDVGAVAAHHPAAETIAPGQHIAVRHIVAAVGRLQDDPVVVDGAGDHPQVQRVTLLEQLEGGGGGVRKS